MNEIYWITRLGSLHDIGIAIFWVSLIISIGFLLASITTDDYTGENCFTETQKGKLRKTSRNSIIASIIGLLMWTFIPTEEEAFLIYGVGGTVDYLKENPTAKQLPDKCIKALDTWVDNLNIEDNTKENK